MSHTWGAHPPGSKYICLRRLRDYKKLLTWDKITWIAWTRALFQINDKLAGADPPPKKTSDVYAVTAGVKGGSFPPLKNLGISISSSALSLHLRTNFYHILFNSSFENLRFFNQWITLLDHFLCDLEFLTSKFGFFIQKYIEIGSTTFSYGHLEDEHLC